jgi:hypothetical protein
MVPRYISSDELSRVEHCIKCLLCLFCMMDMTLLQYQRSLAPPAVLVSMLRHILPMVSAWRVSFMDKDGIHAMFLSCPIKIDSCVVVRESMHIDMYVWKISGR